jgi:hypothetical protein
LAQRAGAVLSPVLEHPAPADSVQDAIHFTYDDHQAATAMQNAPGQPNRIRAIRTRDAKYAFYFDPEGSARTEYELYDLVRDPLEVENLLGVRTGEPRSPTAGKLHSELRERLDRAMDECRTEQGPMRGIPRGPESGFGRSLSLCASKRPIACRSSPGSFR